MTYGDLGHDLRQDLRHDLRGRLRAAQVPGMGSRVSEESLSRKGLPLPPAVIAVFCGGACTDASAVVAVQSRLERSRRFGTAARTGRGTSPKHAADPMRDDQKATQSSTGMTFFPSMDWSLK
jgi:hypothetical protein